MIQHRLSQEHPDRRCKDPDLIFTSKENLQNCFYYH
jgi:hypothetical protein